MNVVGKFEKVSFDQFLNDYKNTFPDYNYEDPSILKSIKTAYDEIELPTRGTVGSAGYDFHSPCNFDLYPGKTVKFPTGIRAKVEHGWVLNIYPRSSIGFKYATMLVNTVGIIDEDYYFADNEGHIQVKLMNHGEDTLFVKRGDKLVQGVFTQYGITEDDNTFTERTGGIGSTGK